MKIECRGGEVVIPAEGVGPSYRQDQQSGLRRKVSLTEYEELLLQRQERMCDSDCKTACKAKEVGSAKVKDTLISNVTREVMGD